MDRRRFLETSLAGLAAATARSASASFSEAGALQDSQERDAVFSLGQIEALPELTAEAARPVAEDWLVVAIARRAGLYRGAHPNELVLTNGLIRRVWRLRPNAATVAFDNLMTGDAILRGVKPEAVLELGGERYDVGGLLGQPDYAYLRPEWIEQLRADPQAFRCTGFETGKTRAPFAWQRKSYSGSQPWPAPGAALALRFEHAKLPGITVVVHYELFDGIPLLAKWLTLRNSSGKALRLNRVTSEVLAAVEYESSVDATRWHYPNLHVETDYAFGGSNALTANHAVHWLPDPQYTTEVNYALKTPCLLEVRPPIGPEVDVPAGGTFTSPRAYELVHDSTERERQGLAVRRLYRTVAPWATENPIFMHVTDSRPESVRAAIDQCADVGFEMVILSFGSGFDIERTDPDYLRQIKELVEYARGRGIELGGYSLLASRSIDPEDDVINPQTGKPGGAIFGNSPCLGSRWGLEYFRKLHAFIEQTGLGVLEHDGSYPGDLCASTHHPGHRGLEDSQWTQWKIIADFYRWCRARGVYLNVPDWYFLNGSNKTGMGYREVNWSLPRDRQIILGRQNIFDGTWEKTPSMGWMFVPLVQYHGGGAAATLEPLREHLDAYAAHLAQNFGSGVQAAYRGPRLYDAEETRAVVKKWVDFYKAHRAILESDVIHVHRADGRDVDAILHVNPRLPEKGLAMVYNPRDEAVTRPLTLPLYYTGLTRVARVREQDGPARKYLLDREYQIKVRVKIPARGLRWLLIE
jgi:hypothetical protein